MFKKNKKKRSIIIKRVSHIHATNQMKNEVSKLLKHDYKNKITLIFPKKLQSYATGFKYDCLKNY